MKEKGQFLSVFVYNPAIILPFTCNLLTQSLCLCDCVCVNIHNGSCVHVLE